METKKFLKREISLRFIALSQYLMHKYNIESDSRFASKLGIHSQVFSDIKIGKLQVGIDTISILLSIFTNINLDWLFTGRGEMVAYHTNKQKEVLDKFYLAIKNDPQLDRISIKGILTTILDEPEQIEVSKSESSPPMSNKELIDEMVRLAKQNALLEVKIAELEHVKKHSQPITYGAVAEPIPELGKGKR